MGIETRLQIIRGIAEEIVTEEELRHVLEIKSKPIAYDGFEPSGLAPIHFGLLRAANLKSLLKANVKFKLYLADYFGFLNNKLGGDLEAIKKAGEYFIEVWKACGIEMDKVEVVWASDLMNSLDYWDKTMRIAREISLERNLRATTILGRSQGEKLNMGQLFYPPMQVTDIFHMEIDICQLGMDQRRAHMLARDVAGKLGWKKPVAVHHHILLGLRGIEKKATSEETLLASKMSKSDPSSAIYMHEPAEQLQAKVNSAFCPAKAVEGNPILEYCRHIIFKNFKEFNIERPRKYGGDLAFHNYQALEDSFRKGQLHPQDLKKAAGGYLDKLISPVRRHFEKNKKAKELYDFVRMQKITR